MINFTINSLIRNRVYILLWGFICNALKPQFSVTRNGVSLNVFKPFSVNVINALM